MFLFICSIYLIDKVLKTVALNCDTAGKAF